MQLDGGGVPGAGSDEAGRASSGQQEGGAAGVSSSGGPVDGGEVEHEEEGVPAVAGLEPTVPPPPRAPQWPSLAPAAWGPGLAAVTGDGAAADSGEGSPPRDGLTLTAEEAKHVLGGQVGVF